ncbi:hypothetical protein DIX60_00205 [Streptococcus iniae]|uniref:MORN repeat protein n=2 Tax=Streptococcus iniae TaxID=1346 RepID=A0A3L8GTD0_STRIN|nr:membrane protein [Streptococcus iniae]EKB52193.1 MORN repeat family protein [Streptococcus iniae 9117]ESR10002.1 membrane protein [Streptococcus iniae IUSA1]ATX38836.1 hypothetical protein CTW00_00619 [Streptococcus iniae]AYB01954.1 hypothetical protein D5R92_05920 [Streptococcus iniae]
MNNVMEKLSAFIQRFNVTRAKLEIVTLIIIVVCGLSVVTTNHKSKTALTYDNGNIHYTGYVVNYRMTGKGKLVYANGDTYVGDFKKGIFDGNGTFKASTGWTYTGDFKKGQADGKGVLKAKNNKVYKGTFKQGIYQK